MEHTEDKLDKTDVTELQILREHTDYLSVIAVHKDTIFSASGDENIYLHRSDRLASDLERKLYICLSNISQNCKIFLLGRFPTGKQHYDMLRTQERNSVAVLYQGPQSGIAPAVERQTVSCQGKLCKAGKSGLAKSSSSFQVTSRTFLRTRRLSGKYQGNL